jgi:uncharacterized membrane protein
LLIVKPTTETEITTSDSTTTDSSSTGTETTSSTKSTATTSTRTTKNNQKGGKREECSGSITGWIIIICCIVVFFFIIIAVLIFFNKKLSAKNAKIQKKKDKAEKEFADEKKCLQEKAAKDIKEARNELYCDFYCDEGATLGYKHLPPLEEWIRC